MSFTPITNALACDTSPDAARIVSAFLDVAEGAEFDATPEMVWDWMLEKHAEIAAWADA